MSATTPAPAEEPKAKPSKKQIGDAELIAMHEILTTLEDLGEPAAGRVLAWVTSRYAPAPSCDLNDPRM